MVVTLVLAVSVLLQFSAAILAMRLIRVTGRRTAWALIATAVFLMAIRRSITLFRLLSGDLAQLPDLTAELVALVISVLMVAGIARIAPLFHAIRQSEEALRGSQERLRLMVGQMGAILWTTDDDLRFTSSQGAELEALNLRADQVVGQTLCEYFQTDDPEFVPIAAHHRALRGEPVTYEQTWTGNTYQTHLGPLHDVAGDIAGVIGVSLDITERKRAELELLEAERRFRTLLENVSLVAVGLDQDGNVAYANPHFLALTGYTLDKVVGKDWFQTFIPERERPVVGMVFSEIMETGIHPHYENHFLTKEGEERLIVWNNTLLVDPDGKPVGTMSIGEDITERKQAEEALTHSHDLMRYIIEHNRSDVAVHDRELKYVYVSQSYLQDYRVKERDIIGKHHYDVFPDLPQKWRDVHQRVLAGEILSAEDDPYMREDGTVDWTRWECRPWYEADGLIGGIIVYTEIVTERVRAEEELRKHREHLEELVAERTVELRERVAQVEGLNRATGNLLADLQAANRKLEATARELEVANADLETFAYSVSHDLRAPLRAISGFAQIIARRHRIDLNDEGQRYFDNIVQASAQMDRLIDDLLRYARLGSQAIRRRPVPLADVLAGVVETMAARVTETGAQIVLPADRPLIDGDATLLSQIFANLIHNALTYCRPGIPPQVRVSCQTQGGQVTVCVADNGIGIAPEFHERIFQMFQRLHGEDEYPGTGVGLTIVKRSATLLGGRVWVESAAGEGSTFCVQLPGSAGGGGASVAGPPAGRDEMAV